MPPNMPPDESGYAHFFGICFCAGRFFSTPEIMRDCIRLLCFLPEISSNMRLLLSATLLDILLRLRCRFSPSFGNPRARQKTGLALSEREPAAIAL